MEQWDAFICHASEDKQSVARPLANELNERGLRVWYDEFSIRVGDSLRQKIDRGLAQSRFGIVIFSHNFFTKHWPQRELDGLFSKEAAGGKVILPVWHEIGVEDIRRYSPMLADRYAAIHAGDIRSVADSLMGAISDVEPSVGAIGASEAKARPQEPQQRSASQIVAPKSGRGVIGILLSVLAAAIAVGVLYDAESSRVSKTQLEALESSRYEPVRPRHSPTKDVRLEANGAQGTVRIHRGDPYVLSWWSTGRTACVLTAPTGPSGVTLAGITDLITPDHPWYPTSGKPTVHEFYCTEGVTSVTDRVTVEVIGDAESPTQQDDRIAMLYYMLSEAKPGSREDTARIVVEEMERRLNGNVSGDERARAAILIFHGYRTLGDMARACAHLKANLFTALKSEYRQGIVGNLFNHCQP